MAEHNLSAEPTHSRWNHSLAPRLTIDSGDIVHMECVDSSGAQLSKRSTLDEFLAIDRSRIHALTGPIAIHGGAPGDTLEIEILEVAHKGWGWSSVISGLGFLKDRFSEPFFFPWILEKDVTYSLSPAVIPLRPFCGVMGVAPAEDGEFRTRPPGRFGGNMDVRELCAGARLLLPVLHRGALFSAGDAHAAQGDGEVCINGIECPADVSLRFSLHKSASIPMTAAGAYSAPLISYAPRAIPDSSGEWIVVESATDALTAARAASSRMIDLLMTRTSLSSELHAYLLCSVALKLRLSQVVNEPMITVSGALAKSVLPGVELF